jgi:hypothetical protein
MYATCMDLIPTWLFTTHKEHNGVNLLYLYRKYSRLNAANNFINLWHRNLTGAPASRRHTCWLKMATGNFPSGAGFHPHPHRIDSPRPRPRKCSWGIFLPHLSARTGISPGDPRRIISPETYIFQCGSEGIQCPGTKVIRTGWKVLVWFW